jgi:hypothetical protein
MQFFNPSILYALLALLVPIIVHLFKLRKFKRVDFTNIAFLKKVEIESRKSAQLKKWLTLLSRLLLFTCLVLAFAQPYFHLDNEVNEETELTIYIDNSFSMQAKGKRGSLLEEAQQSVINSLSEGQHIHLVTNTNSYRNLEINEATSEILNINYTATQTSLENKVQRAKSLQSSTKTSKKIVIVSDFEGVNQSELTDVLESEASLLLVQLQSEVTANTWIQQVELIGDRFQPELSVQLATNKISPKNKEEIALSVLDGDEILARKSLSFEGKSTEDIVIPLAKNTIEEGIVSIEAEGLLYDKTFYFSLSDRVQIQIKHVFEKEPASFMKRIYNSPRFNYEQIELNNFDFSELSNTQLLIVDNLSKISKIQEAQLLDFVSNDGTLVIIPSTQTDINSYASLLQSLELPQFKLKIENSVAITNINESHPLFEGVFEDQVSNFDYPTIASYYPLSFAVKPVISLVNNEAFLFNKENTYVFSANIHSSNSTLSKSPLVVPIFYQMAIQSMDSDKIALMIESEERIKIPINTSSESPIRLVNANESVIPKQQSYVNSIEIFASNYPSNAGNYEMFYDEASLGRLSFNFARNQSDNQYLIPTSFVNDNFTKSTQQMKEILRLQPKVNEVWQWFLIFALFFMFAEFLILRFIK